MKRDIVGAWRNLWRKPAFAGLVVLMLSVGVGATTAMFTVVDAMLLRPLPYPNGERMFDMQVTTPATGATRPGVPGRALPTLTADSALFGRLALYRFGVVRVSGGREPAIVASPEVSADLLAMLGAVPLIGRLTTDADAAGGLRAVLISERFWQSHFGADPAVIGRTVWLDDEAVEVAGVLPASFRFPEANIDVWRPLDPVAAAGSALWIQLVGFRPANMSEAELATRMSALGTALVASGVISAGQLLTTAEPLQAQFGRDNGGALLTVFGLVTIVLIVACVNVTTLLLVRASERHAEFAIRSAVGAGSAALLRASAAESILLTAAGAAGGTLLAAGVLDLIAGVIPPQLTFLTSTPMALDNRALAFSIAVSALTCLVCGLAPAWRASRVDAIDTLKQSGRGAAGTHDERWHGALVVAQLALVVVVLAGAGLFMRSFSRLVSVDPGFRPEGLVAVDIDLPARHYAAPGLALETATQIARRAQAGGEVAVTISTGMRAFRTGRVPEAEGGLPLDVASLPALPWTSVSANFFTTLELPIVSGRAFRDGEADAMVVSESLARRFWGSASPLGRRFRLHTDQPWRTIVGVSGDLTRAGLDPQVGQGMEVYLPHAAATRDTAFQVIARSTRPSSAAIAAIKQAVWAVDDRVPVTAATTMRERLDARIVLPQFLLRVTSGFAIAAVVLAAIGVYAVSAFWVARRTRDIAIHVALGATGGAVAGRVLGRAVVFAIGGVVLGLVITQVSTRVIEPWLFATSTRDGGTLIAVAAGAVLLALAACAKPAYAASRVDPMHTLRGE